MDAKWTSGTEVPCPLCHISTVCKDRVVEAAIFGLIGVFVGAVSAGVVQWWLKWLEARQAVRQSKRLVAAELWQFEMFLRSTRELGYWPPIDDPLGMLPSTAWQEGRSRLVDAVTDDVWNRLLSIYVLLILDRSQCGRAFQLMSAGQPRQELAPSNLEGFKTTILDIEAVRKALGDSHFSSEVLVRVEEGGEPEGPASAVKEP
jgi:hypothetical protein